MSPAVQPQLAALSKAPQITTYKAVGKQPPTFFNPAPAGYTPAPTGFNPAPSKFAPTSTAMATAPGFNHYTSAVGVAAATSFQPRVSPPVTLRTSPEGHAPVYTGSPTKTGPSPVSEGGGGGGPGFVNGRYRTQGEPASIKNIKR
ncbi:cdc42 effector protein 1, partial [Aplysia californica]|uniref:Cdc42 effector protein 1 n=1 Tax=Aplysia californica TaxID=6500 RepID=A0ABM0ZVL5_APLCA